MKEELRKLKIGDSVYSVDFAWGVVIDITEDHCFIASFKGFRKQYDYNGILFGDTKQTLFLENPFEEEDEKFPKWKDFNFKDKKVNRYAVFKNSFGKYLTFSDALCTIGDAQWLVEWDKEPEIIEMTVQEICKKLNIDNLKITGLQNEIYKF